MVFMICGQTKRNLDGAARENRMNFLSLAMFWYACSQCGPKIQAGLKLESGSLSLALPLSFASTLPRRHKNSINIFS
jgi:hypothetical protein